jgi:hypothetical protein
MPTSRSAGAVASTTEYAYVEVMACPGGCTNGGGQIRIEDAREANTSAQVALAENGLGQSSKPTPNEQRDWLARVDEAYYSMASESGFESTETPQQISIVDRDHKVRDALKYWSTMVEIPLPKLLYTTYRKVESDVGKKKSEAGETARVVELASKIGGGW